ncbi:GAF domain-containing sensor histidine kinase [Flavobacterium sp. MFBS3-15]|uniref:GAF domain-containing sensor histidine kinase n=1 Tax=Flavobacterium sp. MFBS3-15 TaxID=2989816 RepID=UPI002235DC04|nr:GAF domain-containing sensor histidine kinase [Flavobacterium sp. MFBS3-15]MCW4469918.1 GAF domain-containing sensor histidine kinase [Flavobacterium sp. MFBS3-15]
MSDLSPEQLAKKEQHRLEKLRDYRILDTHSEDTFDKISLMASQIFNAPNAFIVFVDEKRVFIKSNLSNTTYNEVPKETSVVSHVIEQDEVFVINDLREHPHYSDSPFIKMTNGPRFYVASPLKTPEGYKIGALVVTAPEPGEANPLQIDLIKSLSKIIIDKLENRLRYRKTIESQIDLMNIALHEIKNPLASIKLANEIISKDESKKDKMTEMIKSSVGRIKSKLSDLLKYSEAEEAQIILHIEEIDVHEIFVRLKNSFELLATKKAQILHFEIEDGLPFLYADRVKVLDILHNLVSNAIKYSYKGGTIHILARQAGTSIEIEVKDNGQGLDEEDIARLFTKFAKLSSKPTGRETSNGLGLSITKSFVELLNGSITASSEGKDKGTSFIVKLPFKYSKEHPVPEFNS